MARINRRRTIIGLGTIVFGASGFVASGAFTFGSEGSLGDSWVQVEGTNQAVEFAPPQTTTEEGENSEGGDDNGDDDDGSSTEEETTDDGNEDQPEEASPPEEENEQGSNDDSDDSTDDSNDRGGSDTGGDDDQTLSTRVQVVTDPSNPGNAVNAPDTAQWNGTLVSSDIILGTDQGFFRGLNVRDANRNAVSILGTVDSDGYPSDQIAFIIANVGPEDSSDGATVRVSAELFAGGNVIETSQLRFPYRVVDSSGNSMSRGRNLLSGSGVRVPDGHVMEIVVVVDTRTGTAEIERVDNLRFLAEGVN